VIHSHCDLLRKPSLFAVCASVASKTCSLRLFYLGHALSFLVHAFLSLTKAYMKHLETDAAEGLRAEQEIPAPPPRKPPPLRNSTIAPWVLAPGTSLNHRILYDSCSILHLVSRALVFGTSVHRCRLCKKPFLLVVRRTSQSRRSGCRNLDADNTVKIQATDSVDH